MTRIADKGAPDDVYDVVTKHFGPGQIVALTLTIAAVNTWNRMSFALRIPTSCERGG